MIQNATEGDQCVKRMQDEIQFCVQKSYEEITEPEKQETEVKHGCRLGPYLFNEFTNSSIAYISEENPCVQAEEKEII